MLNEYISALKKLTGAKDLYWLSENAVEDLNDDDYDEFHKAFLERLYELTNGYTKNLREE